VLGHFQGLHTEIPMPPLRDTLEESLSAMKVGPVEDFGNFMGAVIDKASFENIRGYLDYAKSCPECTIAFGGGCDDSRGYFVEPTVVLTTDPHCRLMEEDIFGPVLTGGVFATDREAVRLAETVLVHAAGNFYINDKTTGATVGHQPFGGGRNSGTNDKAGSIYNLLRWVSIRTLKECFNTARDFRYPFLG